MNPPNAPADLFPRGFASDNFAGVHPKVLARIQAVNHGHALAYGDDAVTARARAAFSALFGREVAAHFVFNGTGANVTALMSFAKSHGAVLCTDAAHLCNDESTAPERFLGMRLLPLRSRAGKLDPTALAEALGRGHGVHGVLPVALTLTQPTELGTVYTVDELRELVAMAHAHGLGVHVDGARLGCAVAATGVNAKAMLADTGVDAVSFGGTKHGLLAGEAVVFLDPARGLDFPYHQKHGMQLASKTRFLAAQFEALLEDGLWIENGRRANAAARALEQAVAGLPYVEVLYPVEANAVFARIPADLVAPLQARTFFWPWDEREGIVRWMCAWDSDPGDTAAFVAALRSLAEARP